LFFVFALISTVYCGGAASCGSEAHGVLDSDEDYQLSFAPKNVLGGIPNAGQTCAQTASCWSTCKGKDIQINLSGIMTYQDFSKAYCANVNQADAIKICQAKIQQQISDIAQTPSTGCGLKTNLQATPCLQMKTISNNGEGNPGNFIQRKGILTVGESVQEFFQTVTHLCIIGDIPNKVLSVEWGPQSVLTNLWNDYKQKTFPSLTQAILGRLDTLVKSIFTDTIAVWTAKCRCEALIQNSKMDSTQKASRLSDLGKFCSQQTAAQK